MHGVLYARCALRCIGCTDQGYAAACEVQSTGILFYFLHIARNSGVLRRIIEPT
jgi:hypothetical protein